MIATAKEEEEEQKAIAKLMEESLEMPERKRRALIRRFERGELDVKVGDDGKLIVTEVVPEEEEMEEEEEDDAMDEEDAY